MRIKIVSTALNDLSKRFPYAIYYRLEAKGVVVVYRVLDLRRDPKRIRQSLESGRNRRYT